MEVFDNVDNFGQLFFPKLFLYVQQKFFCLGTPILDSAGDLLNPCFEPK
jgi:hypothetical protein